jgi:hypothetical protein
VHGFAGWRWTDLRRRTFILVRSRFMLRMLLGSAICFAVVMIAALGLWWRLSSGPIELNLATPWLKAAIEENFGGNHSVAVGGTQLERDEKGRTSLRLRDIVVRDADGQPRRRRNVGSDRNRWPPHRIRWRRQTADRNGGADKAGNRVVEPRRTGFSC